MTAHAPLSPGQPQANPIRRLITSSPVPSHLHEGLQQHRRVPVALLPVAADPLGGQVFWAATAEARFPLPFVPDNLGMQGAVFVDTGSLFDPSGIATKAVAQEGSFINDGSALRMSTGFSLIWQSPLGPLRADFGEALLKASYDKTELFRFGASSAF